MKFKPGMKVIVTNSVYGNRSNGTILELTKRNGPLSSRYFGEMSYWWNVADGGIGVYEGEISPLNPEVNDWKSHMEAIR